MITETEWTVVFYKNNREAAINTIEAPSHWDVCLIALDILDASDQYDDFDVIVYCSNDGDSS